MINCGFSGSDIQYSVDASPVIQILKNGINPVCLINGFNNQFELAATRQTPAACLVLINTVSDKFRFLESGSKANSSSQIIFNASARNRA